MEFLCEILELPIVLPKEAKEMGKAKKPEFLESIKGWLFPVVLSRSVVP